MTKLFEKYISTKPDADGDAVKTKLSIDCSHLTEADLFEIVVSAAVIKWQAKARKMSEIPAAATYVVPKPGTKVAMSIEDRIATLSKEDRAALIDKLMSETV